MPVSQRVIYFLAEMKKRERTINDIAIIAIGKINDNGMAQ